MRHTGDVRRSALACLAVLVTGCGSSSSSDKQAPSSDGQTSKPHSAKTGTATALRGCVPECLHPIANFLSFPQFTDTHGLAGHAVTRFYLSDVRYGGRTHLFVAAVEAPDNSRLRSGLPAAERVIKSVDVPVAPA